jgi:hypothetical protein
MNFEKDEQGVYVSTNKVKVSYPEKFNESFFDIENNSFWFNHRNEVLKAVIQNYPFEGAFADIGGGNGYQVYYLSQQLADREFILIEPGYIGCRNGRRRGIEQVYNCSFEEFDFMAKDVRGVSLLDVIEHIPDDVAFLRRLVDMTPRGTRYYIAVPAYQWLWNDIDILGGHHRRYDRAMLTALGTQAGLRVDYFTYYFSYVPLPTYLTRTIPYKLGRRISQEDFLRAEVEVHKAGPLSRAIFAPFHSYEISTIRRRAVVPHGGSCLAVFTKE